jgi:hypothetical protein
MQNRKRGRPIGFKLSDESKAAISRAKTGGRLSEETKEKISNTLINYFKKLHPLSKDIYESYKDIIDSDSKITEWYENAVEVLNSYSNVATERSLNAKRMRELTIELNIDISSNINLQQEIFSSNPEYMCELKCICDKKNIHIDDAIYLVETDIEKFNTLFKEFM